MNNKFLIFALPFLIIGCTSSVTIPTPVEKESPSIIENHRKKPKKDIFSKKTACGKLEADIVKSINNPNLIYNNGDPVLEEIFYSPEKDSCLYVFRYDKYSAIGGNCDIDLMGFDEFTKKCILKNKILADFSTKENIIELDNSTARLCMSEDITDKKLCDSVFDKNDKFFEIIESLKE